MMCGSLSVYWCFSLHRIEWTKLFYPTIWIHRTGCNCFGSFDTFVGVEKVFSRFFIQCYWQKKSVILPLHSGEKGIKLYFWLRFVKVFIYRLTWLHRWHIENLDYCIVFCHIFFKRTDEPKRRKARRKFWILANGSMPVPNQNSLLSFGLLFITLRNEENKIMLISF